MGYLQQVLCLVFLLMSFMTDSVAMIHYGRLQSFVNNRQISIPSLLLTLSEGDHTVSFENQDIIVRLKRTGVDAMDATFCSEGVISESADLFRLLLEILNSSLAKQNKLLIDAKTDDGNRLSPFLSDGQDEIVDWVDIDGICLAAVPRSLIRKYNLLHQGIGVLVLDNQQRIYVHQRSSTKKVFPSMYDMFVGGVSSSGESSLQTLLRELKEEIGLDFTSSNIENDLNGKNETENEVENNNENESNKDDNEYNIKNDKKIKNEKVEPYADTVGQGRMFLDNEALKFFLTDSNMSQKLKKSILISGREQNNKIEDLNVVNDDNCISYLGRTTIETNYNHCIVDCYKAICNDKFSNSIFFPDGEIQWGEWVTLDSLYSLLEDENKEFVPDGLQVWNALPLMINK